MSAKFCIPVLTVALLAITATGIFAQSDTAKMPTADSVPPALHPTHDPGELLELPVYSIEEVLVLQNGVVFDVRPSSRYFGKYDSQWGERAERETISTPELYVRGGRLHDNGYMLNGVPIINPITGNMTFRVNPRAISAISFYPGSIVSEYSRANSAIIGMATRTGTPKWSGTIETLSDNLTGSDYDRNWYSAHIGGPLPGLEKGRLFGSVERRWQADREPSALSDDRLPNNWLSGWSYNGRVDYDFNQQFRLSLTADGSTDEWQEYRHFFHFNTDHAPYYKDENLALRSEFNYDRSPHTSYSLGATFYRAERFRGDGMYREDLLAYGRPGGVTLRDATNLFAAFDDPSTPVQIENRWICIDTATIDGALVCIDSVQRALPVAGDESAPWGDYLRHEATWFGVDGRVTSHIGEGQTLTAGFEFQRHTIRYYRNYRPTETYRGIGHAGFRFSNRYGFDPLGKKTDDLDWRNDAKHPINLSLYVKDRIESDGAIVTPSLRVDYFSYDALQTRNPESPLDPDSTVDPDVPVLKREYMEETPSFVRLSPRLNVEVPVDERTHLFVGAGVHYQNIPYSNLYLGHDLFERITWHMDFLAVLGTWRPQPEKMTSVEVGLWRRVNSKVEWKATAFLKKGSSLLQTYLQNSDRAYYYAFRHIDESSLRGIELDLKIAVNHHLKLDFRHTYSSAKAKGPYATLLDDHFPEPAVVSAPLDFDQRHKFVGILHLGYGASEGPRLGRSYPLENLRFTAVVRAAGGLRYTPMPITNVANERPSPANVAVSGPRNSKTMPFTSNIDIRAERSFRAGSFTIVPFVWVKNLFDRKNVANVWHSSGEPATTGWLNTDEGREWQADNATPDTSGLTGAEKYRLKESQPKHYHTPREIYLGLTVRF